MRTARTYLIATLAFAGGTWIAPWMVVPVLAALLHLAAPARFTPGRLAGAAALAWAGILGWTAMVAPVRTLAGALGGVFHAPWWAVVLVTPAVAALLAWSAAVIAELARARSRRPARDAGTAA